MSGPAALAQAPSASSPNVIASSGASPGVSRGAPPGGPPEALQGAPPGASPFQSALATHWARTATAEGHQSNSSQAGRGTGARAHEDTHNAGASVASVGIAAASGQPAGVLASDRPGGTVTSLPDGLESPTPTAATSVSCSSDALAAVGESGSLTAAAAAIGESSCPAVVSAAEPTLSRQSGANTDSPGFSTVPEASASDAPQSLSAAGPNPVSWLATASPSAPASEIVPARAIASTPVPTLPDATASTPGSASAPVSASASASAPASTAAIASTSAPATGVTSQGAPQQGAIVTGATPLANPSGQLYSAESQNAVVANSSWSSQNTSPNASTPRLSALTAPVAQNGIDVITDGRNGGSGRFLADAGEGRATGFGAAEDSSTPNAVQARLTGPQSAFTVTVPTGTLSVQPTSATRAQSTGVASAPTQATSAETSAQSAASIGAQMQTATPSAGASTGTASAMLLASGVPMQEAIDAIHATVAMAARQGIAQARIELQPQELGQISIRLSQTSAGLSARVSADTAAGAQALTQGGSELRQSLSSLGVSLLRLDIGSSGQSQAREQGERFNGRSEGSSASTATTTVEDSETVSQQESGTRPAGAVRGKIVDVLA